jgi:PAS domain S-box-containing protein
MSWLDVQAVPSDPHWYRSLYDALPDAVLVVDHHGRYVDANQAATALLGYTRDEFLALHISAVATVELTELTKAREYVIQEGTWVGEGALRHKDGSHVPIAARVVELITPTATFYLGVFRERIPDFTT